jgi:hypothetical protein
MHAHTYSDHLVTDLPSLIPWCCAVTCWLSMNRLMLKLDSFKSFKCPATIAPSAAHGHNAPALGILRDLLFGYRHTLNDVHQLVPGPRILGGGRGHHHGSGPAAQRDWPGTGGGAPRGLPCVAVRVLHARHGCCVPSGWLCDRL